jgi:hypothetical protein
MDTSARFDRSSAGTPALAAVLAFSRVSLAARPARESSQSHVEARIVALTRFGGA